MLFTGYLLVLFLIGHKKKLLVCSLILPTPNFSACPIVFIAIFGQTLKSGIAKREIKQVLPTVPPFFSCYRKNIFFP